MTHYAEVIGDPVAHSKSPLIHGFWLDRIGIDAEYRRTHVVPAELGAYFELRRLDRDWRGCNVTLPHKIAALDHVEDRGKLRESIGAINTVLSVDGALIGTNTDIGGFYTPIVDLELAGETAIVIGTGGAACAILYALARCEIGSVTLLARDPLKGAALLARFGIHGQVLPMTARLPRATLLVNATSLGMTGAEPLLLDLDPLPPHCTVYDIVYAPLVTSLLAAAEARGLRTVDGLEMLVGQAALAFELFFEAVAPREHDDALWALLTS